MLRNRHMNPQRCLPKSLFITALLLALSAPASAKTIDCHLLGRDKMLIVATGNQVKVIHFEDVSSTREKATTTTRKVLYHHLSEPYDPRYKVTWEPAHSVIALESMSRDSVEFAPDLLIVNWGKVKLKSITPYEERVEVRWTCTRKD